MKPLVRRTGLWLLFFFHLYLVASCILCAYSLCLFQVLLIYLLCLTIKKKNNIVSHCINNLISKFSNQLQINLTNFSLPQNIKVLIVHTKLRVRKLLPLTIQILKIVKT